MPETPIMHPIATAPKDGTVILAHWQDSNEYALATWGGKDWSDPYDSEISFNPPSHWLPRPKVGGLPPFQLVTCEGIERSVMVSMAVEPDGRLKILDAVEIRDR